MTNSIRWFDTIILVSLCVMIFTLPFSKSGVEVCFIIALTFWALKKILFHEPHASLINLFKKVFSGINLPIYLFVLTGFISVCYSVSIALSLKGFFFKLLEGVTLYFIVTETVSNRKKLDWILVTMILSMLLIGVDGIFQFMAGWDFLRHYPNLGRISASFINPNGLGGWLTIMLPLAFSILWVVKNRQPKKVIKFALWILTGILILCLALSRSRGASVGLVFGMIFFIFVIFFVKVKKSKTFLIVLALILAVSLLAAPYFINAHTELARLIKESPGINSWDDAATFIKNFLFSVKKYLVPIMIEKDIVRTHLWREALLIIKDFPVFGCGLNTYSIVAPRYKSGLAEAGIYAHNSYLQMAAETGIVGLISFVLVIVSLFTISLMSLKNIKDSFYSGILLGLLVGLFGFLVHSFFDVNFYALQLATLMWFIMGLIIAVQRIALKEESELGRI